MPIASTTGESLARRLIHHLLVMDGMASWAAPSIHDVPTDPSLSTQLPIRKSIVQPDRSQLKAIRDAVFTLYADNPEIPREPIDGDCLIWTPRVVAALRDQGFTAEETTVTGWAVWQSTNVIAFMHRAALIGGNTIVDVTARQFVASLPSLWVADVEDYRAELATATAVTEVTVGPIGASTTPQAIP